MNIVTIRTAGVLSESAFNELYNNAGTAADFGDVPAGTLYAAAKCSQHLITAWDRDAGKLVGLVRCVSDNILSASIENIFVDKSYDGRSVGVFMLHSLLGDLRYIPEIRAVCHSPRDEELYREAGFIGYPAGMVMHRHTGPVLMTTKGNPADLE